MLKTSLIRNLLAVEYQRQKQSAGVVLHLKSLFIKIYS